MPCNLLLPFIIHTFSLRNGAAVAQEEQQAEEEGVGVWLGIADVLYVTCVCPAIN